MQPGLRTWLITLSLLAVSPLAGGFARAEGQNQLFYYPHMQQSPYTMSAGQVVIGTQAAIGITDFFQVSTDLLRDFYRIFNAQAKFSIVDYPKYAVALTLGFETYNLNVISDTNPDFQVKAWAPGIHAAYSLSRSLAVFSGLRFHLSNNLPSGLAYQTSGYQRGAEIGSDIAWSYNHDSSSSNALALGATYDFTTSVFGIGISHHWPTLHLGIHYYMSADVYRVQPIISGGLALDI